MLMAHGHEVRVSTVAIHKSTLTSLVRVGSQIAPSAQLTRLTSVPPQPGALHAGSTQQRACARVKSLLISLREDQIWQTIQNMQRCYFIG